MGKAESLLHTRVGKELFFFWRSWTGHTPRTRFLPHRRGARRAGPTDPTGPTRPRRSAIASQRAGGGPCARHCLGNAERLLMELCCGGAWGRGAGEGFVCLLAFLFVFHFLHAKKACSSSPVELRPLPVPAEDLRLLSAPDGRLCSVPLPAGAERWRARWRDGTPSV